MSTDVTLADFFNRTLSGEAARIRIEACDYLDALNTAAHDIGITTLLARQDIDDTAIITLIDDVIIAAQDERLLQFGVYVNDTTDIKMRTEILNGIIELEYYLDPATLYYVLDSDHPPEYNLANVLVYTTPYQLEQLLPVIDTVSQDLIDRIETILADKLNANNDIEAKYSPYIDRVGTYLATLPDDQATALRDYIATLPRGYTDPPTLESLVALYVHDILGTEQLDIAAIKLCVVWLISSSNTGAEDEVTVKEGLKQLIGLLPLNASAGIDLYKRASNWLFTVFYRETPDEQS